MQECIHPSQVGACGRLIVLPALLPFQSHLHIRESIASMKAKPAFWLLGPVLDAQLGFNVHGPNRCCKRRIAADIHIICGSGLFHQQSELPLLKENVFVLVIAKFCKL